MLLAPPAAVAPAPSAVFAGTAAPVALPTQTNCACAAGAPSASTNASAVPADKTKDSRTHFMTAPNEAKKNLPEN
jgi:hypothetical protein